MLFFLALVGCLSQNVLAQDGWVRRTEGVATAPGIAAAGDIDIGVESHAVYITGSFRGSKDFDSGLGVDMRSTSGGIAGPSDIYTQRLSSLGETLWTTHLGGDGYDAAYGIVTDNLENSYIIGVFSGVVDFDPGPGVANLISEDLSSFVLKLDVGGNFLWVTPKEGIVRDIEVDQDFVYITGAQDDDILLEKIDQSDASVVWGFTLESSEERQEGVSLGLDNLGDIYVTGNLNGPVDFDPGVGTFSLGSSGSEVFLAKYTNDGGFVWAHVNSAYGGVYGALYMADLFVDSNGDTYATGTFDGQVNLDHIDGDVVNTVPECPFIRKCNSDGSYAWGGSFLVLDAEALFAESHRITVVHELVYLIGDFSGQLSYRTGSFADDMGAYSTVTADGVQDVFLYTTDTDGNHVKMGQITGPKTQFGSTVKADPSGILYIAGGFNGSTDFDPYGGTYFEESIDGDAFVTKLPGYVDIAEESIIDFELYPNPSYDNVFIQAQGVFDYELLTTSGQTVLKGAGIDRVDLDTRNLSRGLYLVKVDNKTKKLIKK